MTSSYIRYIPKLQNAVERRPIPKLHLLTFFSWLSKSRNAFIVIACRIYSILATIDIKCEYYIGTYCNLVHCETSKKSEAIKLFGACKACEARLLAATIVVRICLFLYNLLELICTSTMYIRGNLFFTKCFN